MNKIMGLLDSKKILKISLFLFAAAFALFIFSHVSSARELENTYPKIPIPNYGNPSLNDIFNAIVGDKTSPAYEKFKNKDPFSSLILYFYMMSIMLVGFVALGALTIAGFQLLVSGANPRLRADAKGRLQSALLGIAILFGSWMILNTINPELRILAKPGAQLVGVDFPKIEPGQISQDDPTKDVIDLETLKYGGVIIYEDLNFTTNNSMDSDVTFHDVTNVPLATFVDGSGTQYVVSSIQILGNCSVKLSDTLGTPNTALLDGPIKQNLDTFAGGVFNNDLKSIEFTKKDCLGHSVRVHDKTNYNETVDGEFATFLINYPRLDKVASSPGGGGNGNIEDDPQSLLFARTDLVPAPSITIFNARNFVTSDTGGEESVEIEESVPDLNTVTNPKDTGADTTPFDGAVSSIMLEPSTNRQAGVIVFTNDNYQGTQEVFIASDYDFNNSNYIGQDSVSSLIILGEYRVTLYLHEDFSGKFLQIDNYIRDSDKHTQPTMRMSYDLTPKVLTVSKPISRVNTTIKIPRLSDTSKFCMLYRNDDPKDECLRTDDNGNLDVSGDFGFNDKINDIKLELPLEVFERVFPDPNTQLPVNPSSICQNPDPNPSQTRTDELQDMVDMTGCLSSFHMHTWDEVGVEGGCGEQTTQNSCESIGCLWDQVANYCFARACISNTVDTVVEHRNLLELNAKEIADGNPSLCQNNCPDPSTFSPHWCQL